MSAQSTTQRTNQYEGMFLFPQSATADLKAAAGLIKDILSRNGAELISLRKWDERRLAYAIRGNKRGVYFLAYFSAPSDQLRSIERACNLSEDILRAMVTRADHIPMEQMQAADGQQQLEDEAKLRASGAAPAADSNDDSGSADHGNDSDDKESYADSEASGSRP